MLLSEHWQLNLPQDQRVLTASCGFAGATVLSTFYAVGPNLDELASKLGVTYAQGVLIGRLLTDAASTAERWIWELWAQVRPAVMGLAARTVRIKNC